MIIQISSLRLLWYQSYSCKSYQLLIFWKTLRTLSERNSSLSLAANRSRICLRKSRFRKTILTSDHCGPPAISTTSLGRHTLEFQKHTDQGSVILASSRSVICVYWKQKVFCHGMINSGPPVIIMTSSGNSTAMVDHLC